MNISGHLTCNDLSGSRVKRLLDILQFYIPEEERNNVTVTRKSGLTYNQPDFDKVNPLKVDIASLTEVKFLHCLSVS
jgi:hypothetical protein